MRKNRFLKIRISQVEQELLRTSADAAGLTITKYIRSLVFSKKFVPTKKTASKNVTTMPTKLEKAQNSYRRFAEPGALLKK